MSISAQVALTHLRTIKPNDGWSVQTIKTDETKNLQLLRRNVPLSDNSFLDIHYCSDQNVVVGLLTTDGSTCQVLVDEQGKPVAAIRVVAVSTYDPKSAAKNLNLAKSRQRAALEDTNTSSQQERRPVAAAAASDPSESLLPNLTPEQNKELVKYALIFLGVLVVAKILASAQLASLLVLAMPLVYLYALQTCPPLNSFDAKRELKRVLRGQHLPENHPSKPKGFLEEMAARVTASVTAELATFPGYELEMTSLGGAAWMAHVRVPTAKTDCYWLGVFGKWHYVTSMERPSTDID